MSSQRSTLVNTRTITSVDDVIRSLEKLNTQLVDLRLKQFLLFNRAYLVVTNTIRQAMDDGYFQKPAFIDSFIVHFAAYYFQAVNDTASASPTLSAPWAKLNQYAADKSAPIFISLMLGANAHINNDLPQVLNAQLQKDEAGDLLEDLVTIDKLLMKSGKEIIGIFSEKNNFLNFLKRYFQFLYYRPAMYTILFWRAKAWKNYRRLKHDKSAIADISEKTVKTANQILKISNILS